MLRVWSEDLPSHVGERVRIAGWYHHFRQLRSVSFLVLRDATGIAQIVVEEPALIERLAALPHESVVTVEGLVQAEPQAPGGVEVREPVVEVLAQAAEEPPLELYRPQLRAQLRTILDHAPVALRHPRRRALFEIAAASTAGFRETLRERRFVEIHTPKLVGAATEGGANVFAVDYFGRPAYLAQSPQLYKQIMVGVFERVYEVGPVFRAEPHDTPRHLNEYVSLDVELGFIQDHRDVMEVLTEVVRGMLAAVRAEAADAVARLGLELPEVPMEIPCVKFGDHSSLISDDLSPAEERSLGAWARREHGSDFLFVTGYPSTKRPFYTHPDPARPGYTNSFDLLFRGVELVSGGQRLHRYGDYLAALELRGMRAEAFGGYLETFKYGMPPHGGFGLGLERWVAQLAGVANIKEATLFPRDLHRLDP